MTKFLFKRIYDDVNEEDGHRIFFDRLWPRGLKKEEVHFDEWRKEFAPSTELRKWFHADMSVRGLPFEQRYKQELEENPGWEAFRSEVRRFPVVTLLTATKDARHSYLAVLKELLE